MTLTKFVVEHVIMAMTPDELHRLIAAGIPDAAIEIQDLAGDGEHYKAIVTAPIFAGKSRVAQHQLVYAAINNGTVGGMGVALHALSLETRPTEQQ